MPFTVRDRRKLYLLELEVPEISFLLPHRLIQQPILPQPFLPPLFPFVPQVCHSVAILHAQVALPLLEEPRIHPQLPSTCQTRPGTQC